MKYEKSYNPQFLKAIKDQRYKGLNAEKDVEYSKPQIVLQNVNTVYEGERYPTLYDINLKIYKGEFVLIVGPNGSGKTTLLETILGMLPVKKGTVKINEKSVFKHSRQLRKKIGYLIQGVEFDPQTPFLVKTVVMTARSGRLGILKFPKKEDKYIARFCFDAVRNKEEVEDYWERPVGKLSGGMQQKVRIANILAAEPEILFLDEPFANLDVNARQDMFRLFLRLNHLANITTLCVSHRSELPKGIDRVVMIQKGRIVLNAEPEIAVQSEKYRAYCQLI